MKICVICESVIWSYIDFWLLNEIDQSIWKAVNVCLTNFLTLMSNVYQNYELCITDLQYTAFATVL